MRLSVIASLLLSQLWLVIPGHAAGRPPTPVFTYQVGAGDMAEQLEFMGRLSAIEHVDLSAAVSQTISAIHFKDGQTVTAGDLILELTSAEEHAQLEQLQAQLVEAQRDYERVAKLKTAKLTSDSVVEQKRATLDSLLAQSRAVRARLADRLIVAPFNGRLGLRRMSVGNLVRPGDVIATLDDSSQMNLDIDIPESLYEFFADQPSFTAQTLNGNVELTGKVDQFDNRTNPTTHNLTARAKVPNPKGELISGMTLKVSMTRVYRQQLRLPEAALIQEGTSSYVYILENNNSVRRQELDIAMRQGGFVSVSRGLKIGDKVITHGASRLTAGAIVKIMGEDTGQPLNEILRGAKH